MGWLAMAGDGCGRNSTYATLWSKSLPGGPSVAKLSGPLLSFGATGQIAKTMVVSKWRGRTYARRHVTPANPQTSEQSLTRDTFSWLQAVWKVAPALFTAPWLAYSAGKVLTDRNAFTKFNLPDLRSASDLNLMTFSPGALGGLPPATITVTPGDDQLTVACTAPAVLPVGWTIAAAELGLIRQQNPGVDAFYDITMFEDVAAAYSNVFAGLVSAQAYRCFAFLKWTRPDGQIAYSPALSALGTTT